METFYLPQPYSERLDELDADGITNEEVQAVLVRKPAICFITLGESNTGGQASNSSAFAWEIGNRPELQILNVNSGLFENLDIGTNNNLAHTGLTSATHSWELELANAAKRGEFDREVFYVQTGQGGSTAAEWIPGAGGYAAYDNSFLPRLADARAALAGRDVQFVVWISLGINDAIAGTDSYLFKGRMRQILAAVKRDIPGVRFCIGRIMRPNASYQAIDDRLEELADDSSVRVVSITGLALADGNHWSYLGMRGFSERMLDATRQMVSIPERPLTFVSSTATIDGSLISFSAINQYANATETLDFSYDQSIEIDHTTASMLGLLVILDTDIFETPWSGEADSWLMGVFLNDGLFYYCDQNGAAVGNFSASGIARLRFRKNGTNLILESTTDNATWTTRYTRTGILSGVNYARLKFKTAIGAASVKVFLQDALRQPQ